MSFQLFMLNIHKIFYDMKFLQFRQEEKEDLQRILSDESKARRSKRNRISIHLSLISWAMEFVTGIIVMIAYLGAIADGDSYYWINWYLPLDMLLCSVLIPCTYVFKTEYFRNLIFNSGWLNSLRNQFCVRSQE